MAILKKVPITPETKKIIRNLEQECFPSDDKYPFNGSEWWIAYEDDKPIGYCGLYDLGDYVFLCRAGVLPSHCGKGLHKKMIKKRLQWAKENPRISQAITYTLVDNVISSNNLIKCGFRLYTPHNYANSPLLFWYKSTL